MKANKYSLFLESVKAGFPSPADDYIDKKISLDELLITHPASTYFLRVQGDSMIEEGIFSNDLLIVDKSIDAKSGMVIIAFLDGEFTVKKLRIKDDKIILDPANKKYKPIDVSTYDDFEIWGVVLFVIHQLKK